MNLRSKQEVLSKLKGGPEKNPVVEAVRAELGKPDNAVWFALLAENGPFAIEAQGWQLKAELEGRGVVAPLRDVQDAMLQLAHELLGAEDPRREMMHRANGWISGRSEEERKRYKEAFDEGFLYNWETSAADFRRFLRGCCEAALRGSAA